MLARYKCGESARAYGTRSWSGTAWRRPKSIRFVQPKRVPGGAAVIVKAKLPGGTPFTDAALFQPDRRWMADMGLQIEESLIQPDREGYVLLLFQNPRRKRHKLSVAMAVGQLEPCVEVSPGELVDNPARSQWDW